MKGVLFGIVVGLILTISAFVFVVSQIKPVHTTPNYPVNKHDFSVEWVERSTIKEGEITVHRHIDGVIYGCDQGVCKRISPQ